MSASLSSQWAVSLTAGADALLRTCHSIRALSAEPTTSTQPAAFLAWKDGAVGSGEAAKRGGAGRLGGPAQMQRRKRINIK